MQGWIASRGTGEIRIVHEKCEHLRDAQGRVIKSVGMVHDITETRRAADALRDAFATHVFSVGARSVTVTASIGGVQVGEKIASVPQILSRVLAATVGGWAFTWGFVCLGIALLAATGSDYHEAEMLLYLLAFPLFLALFCWAIAARSGRRIWSVLAGGAAAMTALAWLLAGRFA